MKKNWRLVILLTAAMLATGFQTKAHAQTNQTICIDITAKVESVFDQSGVLAGVISEGDVITGRYVYDSTTADTNSLPTVGDYFHTTTPFGITLDAGGFIFRTDPNNVNFLIEIVNDHGNPPSDNYLLRSYNNIFDLGSSTNNHISWQLDDPTLTALSSEALPTVPPVLADWQSVFGLTIESFSDGFFIRSHVTAANLCSDTSPKKVAICHKPGTLAEHKLFVARSAVSAHLSHGDALGECS